MPAGNGHLCDGVLECRSGEEFACNLKYRVFFFVKKMVHETALKIEKDGELDGRKWSKPIMEKRRRERINRSLEELKRLVLEAQNRDSSRYTKLEKADILEMTVRHLRALQCHQRAVFAANDPRLLSKYRAGYNECVAEVSKHMTSQDGMDPDMKSRILSHLAGYCRATRAEDQVDSNATPVVSTSFPYTSTSDFKMGRRRIFPREAKPAVSSSSLPTYLSPPYSALSSGSLTLQSSAPVTFLPIYGTDLGGAQGMSPVFPSSPPSTLQLRDPLWRPW